MTEVLVGLISLRETYWISHIFWFVVIAIGLYGAKIGILRLVDRLVDDTIRRRLWNVRARNVWLVSLIAALLIVFGPELRTMALSLAAIAVAIVIALREMILCFVAFLMREGSKYFDIGDVIEIDGRRGEVIDVDWIRFKIAVHDTETGAVTGKILSLPNNVLFTSGIMRDPLGRQFVREKLAFEFERTNGEWLDLWRSLPSVVSGNTGRMQDTIARYARRVRRLNDVEPIDNKALQPQFEINATKAGNVEIVVRYLVTREERERIRNAIIEAALSAPTKTAQRQKSRKPKARTRRNDPPPGANQGSQPSDAS